MLHGYVCPIECYIRKQREHSMQQIAIETRPKTRAATEAFSAMRGKSLQIAAPLSPEDCQVQSMLDASPIKWHLAHTGARGSSVATTVGHERVTYCNFFPPDKRWQFTGIRLAH